MLDADVAGELRTELIVRQAAVATSAAAHAVLALALPHPVTAGPPALTPA